MKSLTTEQLENIEKAIYAYRFLRPHKHSKNHKSYTLQTILDFEKETKLNLDYIQRMRKSHTTTLFMYNKIMAFVKENKPLEKKVENLLQLANKSIV